MFREEFEGLPEGLRIHLEEMLELQIRRLSSHYGWALGDPERKNLQFAEVCGKIHSVFDMAARFKRTTATIDATDESGYV